MLDKSGGKGNTNIIVCRDRGEITRLDLRSYLAVALWGGGLSRLKVEYAPRLRVLLSRV